MSRNKVNYNNIEKHEHERNVGSPKERQELES